MSAPPLVRPAAPSPTAPATPVRLRRPGRSHWPTPLAAAVGLGLVGSIALPLSHVTRQSLAAPGGVATLAGNVTAMAGTYLLLVMVLLAARLAVVERALGQDRLLRWHRRLSSAPLVLLGAHAALTTLGFAEAARLGFLAETGSLITTMGWIFAAVVAYAMLVGIAVVSIRALRRRFHYDTWWVIHLYTYLALALSVPHQIFDGSDFAGHPLVEAAWIALWVATAGVVLVWRIALPIARSLRHQLRVVQVCPEGPGVYSVVVRGRALEKLRAAGGQYFAWRFLTRDLWWHAHPFSLSALPAPPYLRVTIKATGDASRRILALRPGTRVAIEGPYGTFTAAARTSDAVALVGAGVGITPLRALLEDLPRSVDVVLVHRASTEDDLVFRGELSELVARAGGRAVAVLGPRRAQRLEDPRRLHELVPDLGRRDLYVCGPADFARDVIAAARRLGVPRHAIHHESFEL